MGCGGCAGSRGCSTVTNGLPKACGTCGSGSCNKLNVYDWLANMELPAGQKAFDVVEVRFKNSRKEFFRNVNNLPLSMGEVIAVEGTSGHDIGTVSASGEIVKLLLKRKGINFDSSEIRKVYRIAKPADLEKWKEVQALEVKTMYHARTIAVKLGLQMKISDVEYQGDGMKATFYYTADDRVDFRELIKVLASEFRVRIEMRQIGARQEASRLGGIGSCGRELCCSTWLTDFRTVNTGAARYQQLSLNPLKLAGQCGKLKCCLNYELDAYMDALKHIPESNIKLQTQKGPAFHQKTDIFRGMMWYSYESEPSRFIALSAVTVKGIIEMNKGGQSPAELVDEIQAFRAVEKSALPDFENVVGQDSLTRFDHKRKKHKGGKNRHRGGQEKQAKSKGGQAQEQNKNQGNRNHRNRRNNPNRNKPPGK
ncbi:MAG: hypothetical protein IT233_03895 [Bacteroidia bacterium]|nr:hypothetical protein [Bacteroidia bacterium]